MQTPNVKEMFPSAAVTMGSLFGKTTDKFRAQPSIATQLARNFTACRGPTGSRDITIRLFDPHELVKDMVRPQEVITELESFLNGMDATPGLEASTVAELSAITFRVTHSTARATEADINSFAVNDFPVHFLTATHPQFKSSSDDIVKLLVSHRIPEQTFVGRRQPGLLNPVPLVVNTYATVERDWAHEPGVLGFGFPGTYLIIPDNQRRCRKVGIIKMQGFMTEHLPQSEWKKKLLSVLRHELGHMMGLRHEANTLMDGEYGVNVNFSRFTPDQLWIVGRALTLLMGP